MPKQSPLIPKLLAILEAHGWKAPDYLWPNGPPADLEIRRTNAGYWQRNRGAWSWFLWSASAPLPFDVGSQYPATECARIGPEGTQLYENPHGQVAILLKGTAR